LLNDRDLVISEPLGVQLEYVGPWVFDSITAATPCEGCFNTHPTLNTPCAGSSGCSCINRFGWHFVANFVQGGPREGTWHPPYNQWFESESFLQNLWASDGQTQYVCTQGNEHFLLQWCSTLLQIFCLDCLVVLCYLLRIKCPQLAQK